MKKQFSSKTKYDNFDNMGFSYKKIVNVIYHILSP